MRVLVVGSGAREDALSWRIAQSPSCEAVLAAPGNAGTAQRGVNWQTPATDGKRLAQRCLEERIDLVVLGPETAIAAGVGDRLRDAGVAVFGPSRAAGRLESSKVFAKRFMERHGVPTARATVVHSLDAAVRALKHFDERVAIKADGLASGKGVVVAESRELSAATLAQWYGNAKIPGGGNDVLIEECLLGRELSLFAICDGARFSVIGSACDYKRAGDGDTGPNTGGMGAYSPPIGFPTNFEEIVHDRILDPVQRGLAAEGETYIGVLYCGLMWTADGPYVIEFNARFGDPETQVLMPRLNGDVAAAFHAAARGALDDGALSCSNDACVGVVLATAGYPGTATPLRGLPSRAELPTGSHRFWGNATLNGDAVDSAGGRVMTVAATGVDVGAARALAYDAVRELAKTLGAYGLTYRGDIAQLR